jgi:hypothetical protein
MSWLTPFLSLVMYGPYLRRYLNNDYVITSHDQDQGPDLVMKEKNGDEQNSAPMTMTKDPNHKDPKNNAKNNDNTVANSEATDLGFRSL